jgi:hypothetical protein
MLKVMYYRKLVALAAALVMVFSAVWVASATPKVKDENEQRSLQTIDPLNLAILIQDDLVPQVGNELKITRDFIRSLPQGSQVMVGYITAGSLQVRQPFTSSSPFNPYVEVVEALRKFDRDGSNANAILLISDGLDTSRGFDSTAAGHTVDIDRTIKEANKRGVSIFSFYAPSVGLTSHSRIAASYGQSSLNRVSDETGGRAFFQGTSGFVTFNSYFARLRETLNRQYARAR